MGRAAPVLYAVLQRHLEVVAEAIEQTCEQNRGQPVATMALALVTSYFDAKIADVEASRALYLASAELDTSDLFGDVSKRIHTAMAEMLASAADAKFDDIGAVTFALRAALAGAVRALLERNTDPAMLRALRAQLPVMCRAYLMAVARIPRA